MKKVSALLVVVMLTTMLTTLGWGGAIGETVAYKQSPILDAKVASGELPPVEERLPKVTKLPDEILPEYLTYENGKYGGTIRFITSQVRWDADVFVGMNEAFLTMESAASAVVTPNIVESFEANEEQTEFTFKLREGLKWSDGEPVTMEDIRFTINDFVMNETLNPVVSAWMRDGGIMTGDPFTFEEIDEWTFKLKFKVPYGGFAVHLSIAGWKGYTELLKPAHFLKRFHPDYAVEIHGSEEAYIDFMTPYAKVMGYETFALTDVFKVFEQIDCTNWEITDVNDVLTSVYFKDAGQTENFPVLYAWVMTSSANGVSTFERNPYYHKVDSSGQQLPYVDTLTSTLVENMEMVQMKYISGEADFGRESATIDNITLYKENEAKAGITAYVTRTHTNPTDIMFNVNYPDPAWQEVATDVRFRKALALAIDPEEILDSVYKGFGSVNPYYPCEADPDAANALLDEMGMKIGADGYRTSPSGLPFSWSIYHNNEANDIIPVSELLVEFWSELGLKVDIKFIESASYVTMREANEVTMRVAWIHTTQLWHYLDWFLGEWAPMWNFWWTKGQQNDWEPPQEIKDFYLKVESLMTVDPETAVNEILPELVGFMGENLYIIEPLIDVQQCVIINSGIGNVPTGGVGISWNFAMEQFFYK
ncbi:MAG: ABC transporter substrate-binding protein [Oscillospiraceae bacterium]|jgi:peptide/nickel transport system substrate-binding protein|nr:ABC transporter substrate-binding protein [Oscillospiraceae bacterium]